MKLKEIKPGMVIHCNTEEEKKILLDSVKEKGYVFQCLSLNGNQEMAEHNFLTEATCLYVHDGKIITWSSSESDDYITHEFSDLIIEEEMSAEEMIEWLTVDDVDGQMRKGA